MNSAPPGPPQGSPQENCGICRLFRPGPAVIAWKPSEGGPEGPEQRRDRESPYFPGQTSACKSGRLAPTASEQAVE